MTEEAAKAKGVRAGRYVEIVAEYATLPPAKRSCAGGSFIIDHGRDCLGKRYSVAELGRQIQRSPSP